VIAFILVLALFFQGAPAGRGGGGAGTAPAPGVITGQVVTRDGAPATSVRIAAIPAPPPKAKEGLNYYIPPPPTRVAQTDDQGRYRLTNLPPGQYLVAAGLAGVGTYYPSERDPLLAGVVDVQADAPATANVKMVTPIGARVSGRVTPPPVAGSGEIAVMSGVTLAELAEVPVAADGQFAFGRVPAGRYLVSIFPTPPGFGSVAVDIREADNTSVDIRRPPTRVVNGRVVTSSGPIPRGLLSLVSEKSYIPITINPDGTFTARAQSARHRFEFRGMPSGYALASARLGSQDLAQGLSIDNADVTGVVLTVRSPGDLPWIRGTIAGLTPPATVEMTGPIVGSLRASIGQNGSFVFPAATPGLYYLRVPEAPALGAVPVVVTRPGAEIQLKIPAR
jgi:hypothetical protein